MHFNHEVTANVFLPLCMCKDVVDVIDSKRLDRYTPPADDDGGRFWFQRFLEKLEEAAIITSEQAEGGNT